MLEFLAGDFVVVTVAFDVTWVEDDGTNFVDDSVDACDTFCDEDALGTLIVELSKVDVVNGGLPEALLTKGVELNEMVDGVTNRVVDEGVGAAEKGFGTNESTTPTGPSSPISVSVQVSSSG